MSFLDTTQLRGHTDEQYKDAPGMDFADAEATEATQIFEVVEGRDGIEYQVKYVGRLTDDQSDGAHWSEQPNSPE